MFIKKNTAPADEQLRQLQSAIVTWKVLQEFFADLGPIQLRKGESIQDCIARCLGITRAALDDTQRLMRSMAAGRVLKPGE
jgi:hypothetical protein